MWWWSWPEPPPVSAPRPHLADRAAGRTAGQPVLVFHHVPKCGGTSLLAVLDRWFTVCRDYRQGWAQEFGPPLDLAALDGRHCLCGHFDEAIYQACVARFALETHPPVGYSECSFKNRE